MHWSTTTCRLRSMTLSSLKEHVHRAFVPRAPASTRQVADRKGSRPCAEAQMALLHVGRCGADVVFAHRVPVIGAAGGDGN